MMIAQGIKKIARIAKHELSEFRAKRVLQRRFAEMAALLEDDRFICAWEERWLCLHDASPTTGFDAHYLYHTAWATRILAEIRPEKHVDVGSCLRFISMASAIVPLEFYDFRPARITLPGLLCGQADITRLPFPDASIVSLSSMHVVEHIGMERYGDPFDPQGDRKAIAELTRILAKGGHLLFVVPVGEVARIQYNAHRIYRHSDVISYFSSLTLRNFALILDSGKFVPHASPEMLEGQKYACGCYHFIR